MPPFLGQKPGSDELCKRSRQETLSNVVTIDVGGQLFQTTKQTLASAGSKSLLSRICDFEETIPFIDRDPELFSIMLFLLRTGNVSSKVNKFDIQDVIFEANYYGIEHLLINSKSSPSQFEAFNLEKSVIMPLSGRDSPSSISTTNFGTVHVAHGSKITTFDWSLQRKKTILTHFTAIDSLLALNPKMVAAGATDYAGLQVIDLEKGYVKETLNWENVTKSGSTVQGLGASHEYLFTSFESFRRNSNCIMVYDIRDDFRPVTMVGHYEIFGADLDSAIPATKLSWIDSHNLLMASGSHSGPSGVTGCIKFWDIRSGDLVWEVKEKVDCFADVTILFDLSAIFKVGVNSGEVFYTDLRSLGSEVHWICLGDERKVQNGKKEGLGAKIESHGNQIFCSKAGNIELWSEVMLGRSRKSRYGDEGRIFRKNLMGRSKDMDGARITHMDFGGNKMFVTRKDQEFVEVWQSSSRGL